MTPQTDAVLAEHIRIPTDDGAAMVAHVRVTGPAIGEFADTTVVLRRGRRATQQHRHRSRRTAA